MNGGFHTQRSWLWLLSMSPVLFSALELHFPWCFFLLSAPLLKVVNLFYIFECSLSSARSTSRVELNDFRHGQSKTSAQMICIYPPVISQNSVAVVSKTFFVTVTNSSRLLFPGGLNRSVRAIGVRCSPSSVQICWWHRGQAWFIASHGEISQQVLRWFRSTVKGELSASAVLFSFKFMHSHTRTAPSGLGWVDRMRKHNVMSQFSLWLLCVLYR